MFPRLAALFPVRYAVFMASWTKTATGAYLVNFRYNGVQTKRRYRLATDREAASLCVTIEKTIEDIALGRYEVPAGVDPVQFLASGGRLKGNGSPGFRFENLVQLTDGIPVHREKSTLSTQRIHLRHLIDFFGATELCHINQARVQSYVDRRAKQVSPTTIRKEVATLRAAWGWSARAGHAPPASWNARDLSYPKLLEKPPFQTLAQVTAQIQRRKLKGRKAAQLWANVWLAQAEVLDVLDTVRKRDLRPVFYSMFCFAAFTGARRSEICRSLREDWDAKVVTIREKKADSTREFTRRHVAIHPVLAEAMAEWWSHHPGGQHTFVTQTNAPVSQLRSARWFRIAVKGTKYESLHGWHVFRHSLASILASVGTDQRVINDILGHHTKEMERRYRHLLPGKQEQALTDAFGT